MSTFRHARALSNNLSQFPKRGNLWSIQIFAQDKLPPFLNYNTVYGSLKIILVESPDEGRFRFELMKVEIRMSHLRVHSRSFKLYSPSCCREFYHLIISFYFLAGFF